MLLKSQITMVDDHSSTYTNNSLMNAGHRLRLNDTLSLISKNINPSIIKIVDFGGGSGFVGDAISKKCYNLSTQSVYDIVHPLNEKNKDRKWFIPKIETNYFTFKSDTYDNLVRLEKKILDNYRIIT